MPAYEYQCDRCETHFEQRQKMSEKALETCPQCGGHVKRLISGGAGAITKGHSHAASSMAPRCGMSDGPCCGEACMGNGGPCEQ